MAVIGTNMFHCLCPFFFFILIVIGYISFIESFNERLGDEISAKRDKNQLTKYRNPHRKIKHDIVGIPTFDSNYTIHKCFSQFDGLKRRRTMTVRWFSARLILFTSFSTAGFQPFRNSKVRWLGPGNVTSFIKV